MADGPSRRAHGATRNQHFVSQAEQRLNVCNPDAMFENQRIYEFAIADRDHHALRLTAPKGRTIATTLSMLDLFSWDVDNRIRDNFEDVFGAYEGRLPVVTARLLTAHADQNGAVGEELFALFTAKMLNFVRNPYSVAKVLNTFGVIGSHRPADPGLAAAYDRVLTGRRPHQTHLCRRLGITKEQYEAWLRVMFMLLKPLADGFEAMFQQAMLSLFQARDHALLVHLHVYSDARCLLSDRGVTNPVAQDPHLVFDFNLTANAFIRYAFLDFRALPGLPVPPRVLDGLAQGPKVFQVHYFRDDYAALSQFNRRVVEQSFAHVYCASTSPYATHLVV